MERLPRILLGSAYLLGGILLYGLTHLAAVVHYPEVTEWSSWGRLAHAFVQMGGVVPAAVGVLLAVLGLLTLHRAAGPEE